MFLRRIPPYWKHGNDIPLSVRQQVFLPQKAKQYRAPTRFLEKQKIAPHPIAEIK
jgi:hypothetical protein